MARIRRSKINTKNFMIIPKENELKDEKLLNGKYGNKKCLGLIKCSRCGKFHKETDNCKKIKY